MQKIHLPPAAARQPLDKADVNFAVAFTKALIRLTIITTRRRCFFTSFILASVLRRWGLPLVINIGMRKRRVPRGAMGHCWLTIAGEPFEEYVDPRQIFLYYVGKSSNGICYWSE